MENKKMIIKYESRQVFCSKYSNIMLPEQRGGYGNEQQELPHIILVSKEKFPPEIESVEFLGFNNEWQNSIGASASKTEIFKVEGFDDIHKQLVKIKKVLTISENEVDITVIKAKKGE